MIKKLDCILLACYLLFWTVLYGPRNSDPIIFGNILFYYFIPLFIVLLFHIKFGKTQFNSSKYYIGYLIVLAITACCIKLLLESLLWAFIASAFDYSLTIMHYEGSDFIKKYAPLYTSYLVFFLFYELFTRQFNQKQLSSNKKQESSVLLIKSDKEIIQLPLTDIFYFEGLKDYVKVYSKNEMYITKRTLVSLEEELDSEIFLRTQKSYIVNRKHIEKIKGNMIQINGRDIPIGPSYRELINKIFTTSR